MDIMKVGWLNYILMRFVKTVFYLFTIVGIKEKLYYYNTFDVVCSHSCKKTVNANWTVPEVCFTINFPQVSH